MNLRTLPLINLILLMLVLSQTTLAEIATGKAAPNDLYHNSSPYLAMHGRDPVQWHLWNEKTMAMARAQKKLLFVSSGYFSCHWCHVMQRESYQNKKIAALLNRYYIPVKVDRELSPALDARLVDFVERTQGYSGWPLNAFVTPEGYPLLGMVYIPPDKFVTILSKLQDEWHNDPEGLMQLAESASEELSHAVVSKSTKLKPGIADVLAKQFLHAAIDYQDDLQGGFGQQNKFPSVPQLQLFLQIYHEHPDPKIKQFLQLTLDQMARRGLWDQLGGGFFRYSVDPGWHVPHFEKMLYDNALLAKLYFEAGELFQRQDYTQVAESTLAFALRELHSKNGAFVASLSAIDDHGVEGGYYLWHKELIKKLLNADEWAVGQLVWDLNSPPQLEAGHHLQMTMSVAQAAKALKLDGATVSQRLATARSKLFTARQLRHVPRGTKELAGWNGLMLSALTEAAKQTHEPPYRQAAQALRDYLFHELWDGKSLARAKDGKGNVTDGTLEDYAYVIAGVSDWWKLNRDARDQQWLQQLITTAWQRFYGQQGWQQAQHMLLRYGAGETLVTDSVLPSPSAVLIAQTWQFASETHVQALQQQALRALNVGLDKIQQDPFWYATQISALLALKK